MALGTQYWSNVLSYPDFNPATSIPNLSALPADFVNIGGYIIHDSNAVITRSSTTTPFSTFKATFTGAEHYTIGSVIDGLVMNDFTFEAWIFPTNVTGVHMIFGGGTGQISLYTSGTSLEVGRFNTAAIATTASGQIPINTWTKVAVSKIGNLYTLYVNNVQQATGTYATPLITTGLYYIGKSYLQTVGFVGSIAEILLTGKGKTTFSSLSTTYPRYAAQITGNIVESLPITSWTVSGISASGASCKTATTGTTYILDCPTIEPYTITCSPTVNGFWKASTAITSGYFVIASSGTNTNLYTCTVAGTTGTTEPAFTAASYTDGTVTWTKVTTLVDPISLGTRIPS